MKIFKLTPFLRTAPIASLILLSLHSLTLSAANDGAPTQREALLEKRIQTLEAELNQLKQAVMQLTSDKAPLRKEITLEAYDQITLKTGKSLIDLRKNGAITLSGDTINVKSSNDISIKGSKIQSNQQGNKFLEN